LEPSKRIRKRNYFLSGFEEFLKSLKTTEAEMADVEID
jgi:hypothetical protein